MKKLKSVNDLSVVKQREVAPSKDATRTEIKKAAAAKRKQQREGGEDDSFAKLANFIIKGK